MVFRPPVARLLFRTLGIPWWDLFAGHSNAHCRNYFPLDRKDPKAAAVNASLQDWGSLQGRLFAFPPPQLV